jgi:hypothetical protein
MIIPEVRTELLKIADQLNDIGLTKVASRLIHLESELYRRKRLVRTAKKSKTITPLLKQQIRLYKQKHPDLSEQEIGVIFKVNAGRVSEALIGKRK